MARRHGSNPGGGRDARGTRPLEDLIRDLGYAFRAARRSPVFTLAAVVSLAIPIAFNTYPDYLDLRAENDVSRARPRTPR